MDSETTRYTMCRTVRLCCAAIWILSVVVKFGLIAVRHLMEASLASTVSRVSTVAMLAAAVGWGLGHAGTRPRLLSESERRKKLRSAYLSSTVCALVTSAVLVTVALSRLPVPVPRRVLWLLAGLSVLLSALAFVMLALKSGPRK